MLIKSARYPNELVACKQGSPLVYCLKRGSGSLPGSGGPNGHVGGPSISGAHVAISGVGVEVWLASDSAALLSHTRDVVVSRAAALRHLNWPLPLVSVHSSPATHYYLITYFSYLHFLLKLVFLSKFQINSNSERLVYIKNHPLLFTATHHQPPLSGDHLPIANQLANPPPNRQPPSDA